MDQLLLDGETVEQVVDVTPARVAVTTHRVLVFWPGDDERAFRAIDRPNVRAVRPKTYWRRSLWQHLAATVLAAGLLLAGGYLFDPASFVPRPDEPAGGGGGQIFGSANRILDYFYMTDEALFWLGAVAGAIALGILGLQLQGRERTTALEVTGDDDVRLPDLDEERRRELAVAITPPGEEPPDPTETVGLLARRSDE